VVEGGTLSPAFDKDVTLYSAAVEAASDFTAVANDSNATIAVTLNGVAATNGGEQTWAEGQNIVMVTVTNAGNVKSYAVIVTYTAPEG
jgi:hypothetical protein